MKKFALIAGAAAVLSFGTMALPAAPSLVLKRPPKPRGSSPSYGASIKLKEHSGTRQKCGFHARIWVQQFHGSNIATHLGDQLRLAQRLVGRFVIQHPPMSVCSGISGITPLHQPVQAKRPAFVHQLDFIALPE